MRGRGSDGGDGGDDGDGGDGGGGGDGDGWGDGCSGAREDGMTGATDGGVGLVRLAHRQL